jgi:hypothetical protein
MEARIKEKCLIWAKKQQKRAVLDKNVLTENLSSLLTAGMPHRRRRLR